jgi:hypothetical protein
LLSHFFRFSRSQSKFPTHQDEVDILFGYSLAAALIALFLRHDWFNGSLYKGIRTGYMPDRRVTSIRTSHLALVKEDKPLPIADGIFLTEVMGDFWGKAKRNHIFAGETCEMTIKAPCSRAIGDDLIAYDTNY